MCICAVPLTVTSYNLIIVSTKTAGSYIYNFSGAFGFIYCYF